MMRTGVVLVIVATALFMAVAAVSISAHEPSNELSGAVRQCLDSHDRNSDYCANALALSGMSSEDFWSTLAFKLFDGASFCDQAQISNHPENDQPKECWPQTADLQPVQSAELQGADALVKDCFAKYHAASTRRGPSALANAAAEACGKAIRESGLSPRDFFAKYGSPR